MSRDSGLGARDDAWDVHIALMNHLESIWDQPDNGLWEMRGDRRHFTHSKVMAWVAADRMARAVRTHPELHGPADRWEQLRDTIHADVLAHGYGAGRNTFTQSYGAPGLLMIPRVGLLPPTDPRVLGTITAIKHELTEDGFVKRYETTNSGDGLTGGEGLFLACSFWLVDALHLAGRQPEATKLFERLPALRNDVGLLSEEWDPKAGRQLGNTPQAFSHFPRSPADSSSTPDAATAATKPSDTGAKRPEARRPHRPETTAAAAQGSLRQPQSMAQSSASRSAEATMIS